MRGEPLAPTRERFVDDATGEAPSPQHETVRDALHDDVALAHTEVDERFRPVIASEQRSPAAPLAPQI